MNDSPTSIFLALRPGGAARFLLERGLRLLVPLAFGILVLAPPQIYLERLTRSEFQGGFFQFLPRYFKDDLAWTGVQLWNPVRRLFGLKTRKANPR